MAGYDPDALLEQYYAAEGDTPQEKINALRRQHYAENAPTIRAQKRAAHARRKEREKNYASIDTGAKGAIIEGEYNPSDIRKAITQESTNFVIRDANHPDSLYGELCEAIPRESGFYDVKLHGSPERVKVFNSPVDAKELARIILLRLDYGGEPIRLLSCETGKIQNDTCIAMELSRLLSVDVMAPTEDMYASSSGRIVIESKEGKRGRMRIFHPDGSYEDSF